MYICIIYKYVCVLYNMRVFMALSGGFSLLPLLVQGADDQHHRDGEGILTLLGITLGGTVPFLRT